MKKHLSTITMYSIAILAAPIYWPLHGLYYCAKKKPFLTAVVCLIVGFVGGVVVGKLLI